jgi:E3 ubiquitin-protein ligase RAD18
MTIWNSNCDAARPRTRHELLHDLDVWERTLGGRAPTTGRSIQNAAIIKDKDFDGAAWAAKHDTSFKDLIANARKTRLEAKKKAEKAARETEMEETANTLSQTQEPEALGWGQPSGGLIVPNMTGSMGESYQMASDLSERLPTSQTSANSRSGMGKEPLYTHTDGNSQNTTSQW